MKIQIPIFSLIVLIAVCVLAACNNSITARDPLWDREACAHCRMTISNRRFAAQIIGPGASVRFYDDVGCALSHRHDNPDLQGGTLWVRPHGGDQWVPATNAKFQEGLHTPMGFGFGAVDQAGTLSLAEVESAVLKGKP